MFAAQITQSPVFCSLKLPPIYSYDNMLLLKNLEVEVCRVFEEVEPDV